MPSLKYVSVVLAVMVMMGSVPASAQRTTTDNHIVYYQQLLKRSPRNARAYHGLGDAFIRRARETGDPAYFNRAEEALKRALELAPKNAAAIRHLAYVFYSRHEFGQATIYARKAVEIDPENAGAYGVLGDALLEVGQYTEAEESYQKMIHLGDSLYSRSRLAGLKSIRGDVDGATSDLEQAITLGKEARQPAESIAWAEWQLGSDHFALGKLKSAEIYFVQSLQTYPNYYRGLAGLAQVRAAQQKYDEAIELYRKAIAILPMPEYAAALGDVYAKTGRTEEARKQYDLVEYIGQLNAVNKALYNRELAYFYADQNIKAKKGLELAQRELDYRQDVYAYDVVAWNLYRNAKLNEARDAMNNALSLGTNDAKLFYHAGMIHHRLGDREKAKEYLSRALATNPYFHVLFADDAARTLNELKNSGDHTTIRPQTERR
jgi:tetratricopeptide (TPR) repeat protein